MIDAREAREKTLLAQQLLITQEMSRINEGISEAIRQGLGEILVPRISTESRNKLDELGYSNYDFGSKTSISW